jgi:hypothetical protein
MKSISVFDLSSRRQSSAGDDFVGSPVQANPSTSDTDARLEQIAGRNQLTGLRLMDTEVTDAGLAHVAGLTKLRWLQLDNTNVEPSAAFSMIDFVFMVSSASNWPASTGHAKTVPDPVNDRDKQQRHDHNKCECPDNCPDNRTLPSPAAVLRNDLVPNWLLLHKAATRQVLQENAWMTGCRSKTRLEASRTRCLTMSWQEVVTKGYSDSTRRAQLAIRSSCTSCHAHRSIRATDCLGRPWSADHGRECYGSQIPSDFGRLRRSKRRQ